MVKMVSVGSELNMGLSLSLILCKGNFYGEKKMIKKTLNFILAGKFKDFNSNLFI